MNLENFIQIVINEPIYLTIAVIILLIILYSLLKKLFKMLLLGLSLLVIYVSYLIYTGQELPGNLEVEPIKKSLESTFNNAKSKFDELIEDNNDKK